MKQSILISAICFALVYFLSACSQENKACSNNAVKATIKDFTGLDGCSWVLVLQDGRKLEPLNLLNQNIAPADGLPVWVDYKVETNAGSICMVGEIVSINCISKR